MLGRILRLLGGRRRRPGPYSRHHSNPKAQVANSVARMVRRKL